MRLRLLVPILLTGFCTTASATETQPQASSMAQLFNAWRVARVSFAVAFPNLGTFSCRATDVREDVVVLGCTNTPRNTGPQVAIQYSAIVAIFGPLGTEPTSNSRLVLMSSSGTVG